MKIFIQLSLHLTLPFFAVSQSFIDTTKHWNVAKCSGGGIGWFCENFSYKFNGDTVINNQIYKKLMTKLDSSNYTWGFSIAMREAGNKIYSYTSSGEELSYDFGAKTGDTIKQLGPFLNQPMIVGNIDTITILGVSHKRFFFYYNNLPPNTYEIWIEGIGSLFGVANTILIDGELIPDYSEVTLCYWENNNLIYVDSTNGSCFIINDISEIDNEIPLQINANPSIDNITVKINLEKRSTTNIEIFNMQGQIIKKITGVKLHQGENQKIIPVSDLPSGIYFLKINIDDRLITKKFIKN